MNIDRDLSSRTRYDYEIDLTVLAKRLWNGRKSILGFLLVFTIIGIFIGLFSPIEYTSKTVMVPQIQSKSTGLGGLGSLAAMAGFNLDALQSGSSELSPLVYPQIIQSFPFQRAIIHSSYNWNGLPKPVSLMFYYDSIYKINPFGIIKKYTIGLPQVLFKYLKHEPVEKNCLSLDTKSVMTISKEERDLRILLNEWLTVTVNSKEGYITLTAIGPEPLVCAQIALKAQQLLQKQVAEFKIDRLNKILFLYSLFLRKKKSNFTIHNCVWLILETRIIIWNLQKLRQKRRNCKVSINWLFLSIVKLRSNWKMLRLRLKRIPQYSLLLNL